MTDQVADALTKIEAELAAATNADLWAVETSFTTEGFAWVSGLDWQFPTPGDGEIPIANATLIAHCPTYLAALVEVAKALKVARDELTRWGWGDFHYGAQPQEKPVVDAIAVADAALDALTKAVQ